MIKSFKDTLVFYLIWFLTYVDFRDLRNVEFEDISETEIDEVKIAKEILNKSKEDSEINELSKQNTECKDCGCF